MISTVIVFLIILSILVLVHEFGHFIVAKICGIGTLEFALGLPFTKPIFSKKLKSGLKISIYPLLFGGFVKLLGEDGAEDEKGKGQHFFKANVWSRIAVVVAGVTMNFILAIVAFYIFLSLSSFKVLIPKIDDYKFLSPKGNDLIIITAVKPNSPAEIANLKLGDVIIGADNKEFPNTKAFQVYTKSKAGQPMTLKISNLSLSKERNVHLTPRENPPINEGAIGIALSEGYYIRFQTLSEKLLSGPTYAIDMLGYNVKVISSMFSFAAKTKNIAPVAENVSGPLGIADAVREILKTGGLEAFISLINLLGLLSISLAFINILPIPAMDGGVLAFFLLEAIFKVKVPPKVQNIINQVSMFLLLGLLVLITTNDLSKFWKR